MCMRVRISIPFLLLLIGCGGGPSPQFRSRVERVPASRAPAGRFRPLVAPSTLAPHCEDLRRATTGMGVRVVSFVYGEPAERRVTVTLDVQGRPTSYSDLRGDLIASDAQQGDFTAISINLLRGQALAQNRSAGGESEAIVMGMEEAMAAPNLDRPGELIQRVLSTCVTERQLPASGLPKL